MAAAVDGPADEAENMDLGMTVRTITPDRAAGTSSAEQAEFIGPASARGARSPRSRSFQDPRAIRQKTGYIKWQAELDSPSLFRTREGHILKNQEYYTGVPNDNAWNNPYHAGAVPWKIYHGPRTRTNATLMERQDRADDEQVEWLTNRVFVNTVRVQTLDRFRHKKAENSQFELASQWAPHNRARREYHDSYNTFNTQLDNMPLKELKKVLTPMVLKSDRDAIRYVTKKIQADETQKMELNEEKKDRRLQMLSDMERRKAYSDKLTERCGQRPRPTDPTRHTVHDLSPHLQEMSVPRAPKTHRRVTEHQDFVGLYHVDHSFALEARLPGDGLKLAREFAERATQSARPGFPPPSPPRTPELQSARAKLDNTKSLNITLGSLPVGKRRLAEVAARNNGGTAQLDFATTQLEATAAPPAPDQSWSQLVETFVNDTKQMSFAALPSDNSSKTLRSQKSLLELAPAKHEVSYPVVVPMAKEGSVRPNWRPRRGSSMASARTAEESGSATRSGSDIIIMRKNLRVRVVCARDLPNADRAGHTDAYVVCQVPGRPRTRVKTTVKDDTEDPVWDEEFVIPEWRSNQPLAISVLDRDVVGEDDVLAVLELPNSQFFPYGFEGTLPLINVWEPTNERMDHELERKNRAARPTLELKITVEDIEVKLPNADPMALSMPGARPTTAEVCRHLDEFEKYVTTAAVPDVGNFWKDVRS